MEDNKILENPENNENMEKTENAEELNAELEALAELFRKELAKTTEEFESGSTDESEITETEDGDIAEDGTTDEEDTPELICELCGEAYENGKDGICEECLNELRNRPFKFTNILLIFAIGVLGIIAMRGFWQNVDGYAKAYEAKYHFSKGNITSAKTAYDEAIDYFENKEVNAIIANIGGNDSHRILPY